MHIYHAFIINKHFAKIYNQKPAALFKMLDQIHNLASEDLVLGYKILEQIVVPFNSNNINEYIYSRHCSSLAYYKKDNKHIINDLYFKEMSKLKVFNSHVKIVSNISYPTFIDTLKDFDDNILICDFINKDYFWLDKITK
ncbi:MAG: sporulation inhibitor of replication protein SirA [Bacilli bacterium]|nr:sporulation inhibitor of replication protein SirA [Bacilli bacterium]